ncbi:cell death protein 6 isoform X2 [Nematostella vectensis]|uniref:cell death protein 6 isoform X2 n=1 Tax=Nematostella vectensis TaxID=45351 RepID=UPI00138FD55C|nr:cell death protein 6 isoform X2 [Nematostella vectensis]
MSTVLKWASKKGKQQEGKQWLHAPESLTQAAVLYTVKFYGVTEVAEAKGTEVIKEAITKVQFANHIKKSEAGTKASKLRKVDLKINIDGVSIEDSKSKEVLHSYPLHHISYCADDKRNKRVFAFIAKDKTSPKHTCYVFEAERLAEELTLTVGQAFDLAYRRFLERKGSEKVDHSAKHMTAMQQQIKEAEAEKEALKQKIAQLEKAQQGNNAGENGQSTGSNNDNLLGDDLPTIPGIAPPPKVTRPSRPSQELFDPFDQSSTYPQEPKASTSDQLSSLFDAQPLPNTTNSTSDQLSSLFDAQPLPNTTNSTTSDQLSSLFDAQPSTYTTNSTSSMTPPYDQSPSVNPFSSPFDSDSLDLLDQKPTAEVAPPNNNNNNNITSKANGSTERLRPAPRTAIVPNLPPPPSKQSVKAAKMAATGGAPTPSPTARVPPSQPSAQASTDLLSLESSSSTQSNPFSKGQSFDPFADPIFDPLESRSASSDTSFDRQMKAMQDGFSSGLVMDNNLFSS